MTDSQIRQFDELRKQYLKDLENLRQNYLKKFIELLKSRK